MEKDDKTKIVLSQMQRLCSMREYCVNDIRKKLEKIECSKATSDSIIESLKNDGFIDEQRYSRAFAKDKSKLSGWGPVKIGYHLRAKGISNETVEKVLMEIADEGEGNEIAAKILKKKYETIRGLDDESKIREKLLRFGVSRGFQFGVVFEEVNKILKNRK